MAQPLQLFTASTVDDVEVGPVRTVSIALLRPADSPRLGGECAQYIQQLASVEYDLPPILVDQVSMRVIDGMHRLRAAQANGEDTVRARFFHGTDAEAFLLAVRLNLDGDRPLTFADRSAAVERILALRPQWADRAIASATGLASGTVAAIRAKTGLPAAESRIGRDGRVRPLSGALGRRAAVSYVEQNPGASLREIAKAAGISVGTARDVRERLRRGEHPVPASQRAVAPAQAKRPTTRTVHKRPPVEVLREDPSVRGALVGRMLLRLLDTHVVLIRDGRRIADALPVHCCRLVADAARECATTWARFADLVDRRAP